MTPSPFPYAHIAKVDGKKKKKKKKFILYFISFLTTLVKTSSKKKHIENYKLLMIGWRMGRIYIYIYILSAVVLGLIIIPPPGLRAYSES